MVQEKAMQIIGVMALLLGGLELYQVVGTMVATGEYEALMQNKLITMVIAALMVAGGAALAYNTKWGWVLCQIGVVFYLLIHLVFIAILAIESQMGRPETIQIYLITALLGFMFYHLNRGETKKAFNLEQMDIFKYGGMGFVAGAVQAYVYVA